jgi:predicted metal-dependent peptidase
VDDSLLLSVTVSREKDEIVYKVDRSGSLSNDELEYYLSEIIEGLCKWKPGVCEETVQNFKGKIKKRTEPKK